MEGIKEYVATTKVDINETIDGNMTALFAACLHEGNVDIVKELINLKANVEIPTVQHNQLPLFIAANHGNMDIVEVLVKEGGANLNAGIEKPLHAAIDGGNLDVIEQLIGLGADVNVVGASNETPLHSAAYVCIEATSLLLESGANVHARDDEGLTPFMYACECLKVDIMSLLVRTGADVQEIDNRGYNAFHCVLDPRYEDPEDASEEERLLAIKALISFGVSLDVVSKNGVSVVERAKAQGWGQIVDYLEKLRTCEYCHKREIGMKKCSGCNTPHYCSAEHQRLDWKNHKHHCTKRQKT